MDTCITDPLATLTAEQNARDAALLKQTTYSGSRFESKVLPFTLDIAGGELRPEDELALAFHVINPLAPSHILVIPKGPYVSWDDFSDKASDAEIAGFVRAVGKVARDAGLVGDGYRLLANTGLNSGQEVPHLHVHIFAGRPLGPMLTR